MQYDRSNIFAKIIRKEIPCDKIYEDEMILAFNDIAPIAPVHILVIPKGEYSSYDDFVQKADKEMILHFFKMVQKIAQDHDLIDGYRIISNHGKDAGQTVFHFHIHIIGKKQMSHNLA